MSFGRVAGDAVSFSSYSYSYSYSLQERDYEYEYEGGHWELAAGGDLL